MKKAVFKSLVITLLILLLIGEINKNLKYKSIKAFISRYNYLIGFLL